MSWQSRCVWMQVCALRDKGHKPNFASAFDSVLIHTGAAVVRCAVRVTCSLTFSNFESHLMCSCAP